MGWPGLGAELEAKVKSSEACQVNSRSPSMSPLHPWEWPTKPRSRIHVDFCGPVDAGKVTAVLGPLTLIVMFDDGTETRYHVDHVKITGGERNSGTFLQPELDPLPIIVTTADRQADLPQAPAPPIAEVELDPDPVVDKAPPVVGLEAVPFHPGILLLLTNPRSVMAYEGSSVVTVIDY